MFLLDDPSPQARTTTGRSDIDDQAHGIRGADQCDGDRVLVDLAELRFARCAGGETSPSLTPVASKNKEGHQTRRPSRFYLVVCLLLQILQWTNIASFARLPKQEKVEHGKTERPISPAVILMAPGEDARQRAPNLGLPSSTGWPYTDRPRKRAVPSVSFAKNRKRSARNQSLQNCSISSRRIRGDSVQRSPS